MEAYIGRMCEEIETYRREEPIKVDTVFFGGGTPSLLPPMLFKRVVNKLRDTFDLSLDTEFTVEVNPKTVNDAILDCYKESGVNRLSIGLQSIHNNELKKLGRIHTFDDFEATLDSVLRHGITNVNVDLMYGIPDQTIKSFEETLLRVAMLPVTHLSIYGLILEEGTPLYEARDKVTFPSEDVECDMYELACKLMRERGFLHYEISNYSKEGYSCRHNLKYWHAEEYIGLGISAYSYFNGFRYGNSKIWKEYSGGYVGDYKYSEVIDIEAQKYEYVMLGLRLSEGISLTRYKRLFGLDFRNGREELLEKLSQARLINYSEDRLSLTEKGFYVSNSILSQLL